MQSHEHDFDDASATDVSQTRRGLLKGGSAAIAAAFAGPIAAMASRVAEAACQPAGASLQGISPYGEIRPVNDLTTGLPLISLPPGFSYKSYGWRGDIMSDGLPTPGTHDGMGVVLTRKVGRSSEVVLVRNHEQSTSSNANNIIGASRANVAKHDVGATNGAYQIGGTTNLVWRDGNWVESFASFGGTYRNCAGGSSNWGSWLTNEEILSNSVSNTGKKHGYIFEVPADPTATPTNANPIVDMGRMAHEASALDTQTGIWYLTEDQGNANTLYRFLPNNANGGLNSLHAGGRMQGLKVRGVMNADLRNPTLCQEYATEWVDIANPDMDGGSLTTVLGNVTASGPYRQAYARGAAIFGANEGCWVANGVVYFTDKQVSSSPLRAGRIWALDVATGTLKAIFVSNDITVGNSPDNICVSPRGGLLFNEDGSGTGRNANGETISVPAQRMMALRADGSSYVFAANNYNFNAVQLAAAGKAGAATGNLRNTEWCGACFSPDGRVLFANLQSPGLTVAITGPWGSGTL
ncbi:alkaline phosphatase PhoX [Uliginosibacterium sp. H1]|uniref:alkaline phosphatase PhoX n=1 Tax=Uliginosibacterium sp. H1 TaxID=3114757 RepID=UPI002E18A2A0|nr:alkaline phosphatase PhoX [Uliginosibacterium sp. H1]